MQVSQAVGAGMASTVAVQDCAGKLALQLVSGERLTLNAACS